MSNGYPKKTITEDVTSQVTGSATSFSVVGGPFVEGTLNVHRNGVRLYPGTVAGGDDFEEKGTLDGFDTAEAPLVGDALLVQYEVDDSESAHLLVEASGIDPTA